jgi:hypothetical protein
MAYGNLKVDNIIFDQSGTDQGVTVSSVYRAITSGITVSGTVSSAAVVATSSISGATVLGTTITGTIITGDTGQFTSGTFASLTGTTITGTTINAVTLSSTTGSFNTITGTTITGTTINAVTVSTTTGSFNTITGTTITGTTVNGTTVNATTGTFTSLTGTTTTGTTANFASGVFTTKISGLTVTGTTSSFTTGTFVTLSGSTATFASGIIASGLVTAPSLSIAGDSNTGMYSPGADQIAITTSGVARVSVNASGFTGFGTTSPTYRVEVARLGNDLAITGVDANTAILATAGGAAVGNGASITIAGGTSSDCAVYFGDTADGDVGGIIYSHADNSINLRVGGANKIEFTNTNNLLVLGNITPATQVNYSICTSGRIQSDGTYNNTTANAADVLINPTGVFARSISSIKYKTDVENAELSYSEALIYGSRPVWFRSLAGNDPSDYSYWGFIAEEVAEIDPRMVHWGNDGPEGVQYDRYVVHLVSIIQKQQQRLDALEARIAALEA